MEKTRHLLTRSPYRFFLAAAVLAALMCMFPARSLPPERAETGALAGQTTAIPGAQGPGTGVAAGADLSVRTQGSAYLHRTMTYAPCGHSVQRREALPAALAGLTRTALEAQIASHIPGAKVTGFSAQEVDIAQGLAIPCPLHWVLAAGEDGRLQVLRNLTGETLEPVRKTQIEHALLDETTRGELLEGIVFDDVQALEGYLESLSS